MKLNIERINPFLSAGVGGNNNRELVVFRQRIEDIYLFVEVSFRINVFFAVGTDHKELPSFKIQALQYV